MERLAEFKQEYKDWYNDNKQSGWPSDNALSFIAKKLARPGTKFADKTNGVKQVFRNNHKERELARKRTVRIYDKACEIARLRQERHEVMAAHA